MHPRFVTDSWTAGTEVTRLAVSTEPRSAGLRGSSVLTVPVFPWQRGVMERLSAHTVRTSSSAGGAGWGSGAVLTVAASPVLDSVITPLTAGTGLTSGPTVTATPGASHTVTPASVSPPPASVTETLTARTGVTSTTVRNPGLKSLKQTEII